MSKLILVLAMALLAAGCTPLSQPAPEIRDYDLRYASPAITGEPLEVVLAIPSLGVSATYDREAIVYRVGPNQIGKYFYDRWATNPADLIADALARDFANSRLYRAVTHQRSPLAYNYQLAGEIEVIEERGGGTPCTAVLTMRFLLVRQGAVTRDAVLARPRFEMVKSTPCNKPEKLVQSISELLSQISAQLQQQVYDAIRADIATHPPKPTLNPPEAAGS
ncbi:MAG TPA: ABC-type transport auxiliary lipoprotein family protein [Terriglobales bacterium]|nr:ABC-type transport auxiliary lipoprotein family protein [Terriglobales bacterium]